MSDWRARNDAWLTGALRVLRLRLERLAVADRASGHAMLADWLVAGDQATAGRRRGTDGADRLAALDARISSEEQALGGSRDDGVDLSRGGETVAPESAFQVLASGAGLSAFEANVLLLAAAASLDGAFSAAFAEVQGDNRRELPTLHLAMRLFGTDSGPLGDPDVLLPTAPLRRLCLITLAGGDDEPRLLRGLRVDDRVADYLRGVNVIDDRLVGLLAPLPLPDGASPWIGAVEELARALANADDRWPTVNLVAPPDAGGLQAAVAAAGSSNLRPCQLDVARLAEFQPDARRQLIGLIGREALLAAVAVIVDARAVEPRSHEARAIDELIAALNAPLVIVSSAGWRGQGNDLERLDLQRPGRSEQHVLWRHALARHPNVVNGELDALVQQFDFGPLAIDETVERAARVAPETITADDLWQAARGQSAPPLDDLARRIDPVWSWDDMVVAPDVRAQLRELAEQVEHRAQVYETWGFGASLGRGRGISALFAGPSGTGKTMAAEIIAGQLRLDLYRIDLAGVVSKYVGETEKNLRRVFDAAESSGAILLFDEADALFGTRTEVRDSHDRYANLEINYLLQAMEDYRGLAILATNRRSALDGAFTRRLRFIVEFPFPDAEARLQIWQRAFPSSASLDDLNLGFLARLELSGGSIRSVAISAAFLAAAEGRPIGMQHVVRASAREYGKLARPIGSADFGEWLTVARQ